MEGRIEYITDPKTIVSIIVFIFWLGVIWNNLNSKVKEYEKRIQKLEDLDLDSRLTRMQTDLDWIKVSLDELKKNR